MSYNQSLDEYSGRVRPVIERVLPTIDSGENPIKRTESDPVDVRAILISDGHDQISARVAVRIHGGGTSSEESPLTHVGNDHWEGRFYTGLPGLYYFQVIAWVDHFKTWRDGIRKKAEASVLTELDFAIGADLIKGAIQRATGRDGDRLKLHLRVIQGENGLPPFSERVERVLGTDLSRLMEAWADRSLEVRSREYPIVVDRKRAEFSSWYELFPRSTSGVSGKHGTFQDVEKQLPRIAEMGFHIVYFPPIHPIGKTFRKGKNNSLEPDANDPGSPWAIGSEQGGFQAIHPELGTMKDFENLLKTAESLGLEVALDVAFQCSPDHPWVKEHPQWFKKRPDGSIQYAENPPKKYQDIYPIDFETEDWENLWTHLKDVFDFWARKGVRVFRVDNPHTKSFRFWRWCISHLKESYPDLIFLAEAFTRPNMMFHLAKIGFTQSYTYFTWRNTSQDFYEYMEELFHTDVHEFFRPNFWPNTPDILPDHLVKGGRPAFASRLLLAGTLTSNYGIYGPAFELLEKTPLKEGSEEYWNSEKYEIKVWDYNKEGNLNNFISRLNFIRNDNPALQANRNFQFHGIDNAMMLCYSKRTDDYSNVILVIVNLDPYWKQSSQVHLQLEKLGLNPDRPYVVSDLMDGSEYVWHGSSNYVEIDPAHGPGHVFRIHQESSVG